MERQGCDVMKLFRAAKKDYETMSNLDTIKDLEQRFKVPHDVAWTIASHAFQVSPNVKTSEQLAKQVVEIELEALGEERDDPDLFDSLVSNPMIGIIPETPAPFLIEIRYVLLLYRNFLNLS